MIEFLTGLIVVGVPIAIVYGLGFLTIKIIKESYISTVQIFLWGFLILFSLGAIILVSYLLYLIGVGVWIHLN